MCPCGGTFDAHEDGCGAYVQRGVPGSRPVNGTRTRIVTNLGGVSSEGSCRSCRGSLSGSMTYMAIYDEFGVAIGGISLCGCCINALRMVPT